MNSLHSSTFFLLLLAGVTMSQKTNDEVAEPSDEVEQVMNNIFGGDKYSPVRTYLGIIHLRDLFLKSSESSPLSLDRYIAVGQLTAENCKDETFLEIDKLYTETSRRNIKEYLLFVDQKLENLCSELFVKGKLPDTKSTTNDKPI